MSTRANIVVKDKWGDAQWFYRHSDGYPDGALPPLNIFMKWLNDGKIRNNVSQASGWLILLGAIEYNTVPDFTAPTPTKWDRGYPDLKTVGDPHDWKVGSMEPTNGVHGDIDYLYEINLSEKTLKAYDGWDDDGNGTHEFDADADESDDE